MRCSLNSSRLACAIPIFLVLVRTRSVEPQGKSKRRLRKDLSCYKLLQDLADPCTLPLGGIYPRVLGHEGAGRVVRVGSTKIEAQFKENDLVILSAAAYAYQVVESNERNSKPTHSSRRFILTLTLISRCRCLNCHYCETGHPAYCVDHSALTSQANDPTFVLESDKSQVIGGGFFGQSSFASIAPVKVSCAANVTKELRDAQELRKFAPLGCGIMTGAGTITHVAKSGPADVVAVIGLGGVGLAAICAAKHNGVKNIVAVDLVPSRIELAKQLGATVGLLSSPEALGDSTLGEALKKTTPNGLGCTHILDTTPSVAIMAQCLEALQKNGSVFQLGIKPVGAKLEIDLMAHLVNGRRLVGVIEGDRDPVEALPELVQWSKEGVLPVEKMLKEFPLGDFIDAKRQMEDGSTIKSVLVW